LDKVHASEGCVFYRVKKDLSEEERYVVDSVLEGKGREDSAGAVGGG